MASGNDTAPAKSVSALRDVSFFVKSRWTPPSGPPMVSLRSSREARAIPEPEAKAMMAERCCGERVRAKKASMAAVEMAAPSMSSSTTWMANFEMARTRCSSPVPWSSPLPLVPSRSRSGILWMIKVSPNTGRPESGWATGKVRVWGPERGELVFGLWTFLGLASWETNTSFPRDWMVSVMSRNRERHSYREVRVTDRTQIPWPGGRDFGFFPCVPGILMVNRWGSFVFPCFPVTAVEAYRVMDELKTRRPNWTPLSLPRPGMWVHGNSSASQSCPSLVVGMMSAEMASYAAMTGSPCARAELTATRSPCSATGKGAARMGWTTEATVWRSGLISWSRWRHSGPDLTQALQAGQRHPALSPKASTGNEREQTAQTCSPAGSKLSAGIQS